jgi:hypothetical protein
MTTPAEITLEQLRERDKRFVPHRITNSVADYDRRELLRLLDEARRDQGRYHMAQENLCGSDYEARHHMDEALDEQIAATNEVKPHE